VSADFAVPPNEEFSPAPCGELSSLETPANVLTLGSLLVGARLVLRCRKDWRDATIVALSPEKITLAVGSPSGHTYRVRRPPDSLLFLDGSIPLLCDGARPATWRAGLVRYEARW
jgi:hypothetical protein